jgi:hypothetical protein
MASTPDQIFRKQIYRVLQDRPLHLPADVALYEPIYETLSRWDSSQQDPVGRLAEHIELSDGQSVQFFSGFKGAGKTTELFRLKQRLEKDGYLVLYANALDSIDPSGRLDISDLLFAIAGSFGEQLKDHAVLGKAPRIGSFWETAQTMLKGLKFDGGVGFAGVSLKAELKQSPSFRLKVQEALQNHVAEVKANVDRYIESCLAAIADYQPDASRQVVFLFDSLEQIRGTLSTENEVLRSVEYVFGTHQRKLHLPAVHCVYTVPPWLKFAGTGGRIVLLPSVRQWENDARRTPYEPGQEVLRGLVRRRLNPDGVRRIFGSEARMDPLIAQCGGHIRDLLRLLSEALVSSPTLPLPDGAIDQALQALRRDYLPIYVEDARWLRKIAQSRHADPATPDDASRLVRLLDAHMLLYLRNGQEWYDVHPLLREEVERIVARNEERAGSPAS